MADDAADPGGAQDVAPAGPVDGAVTPPPAVDPFAPAEGSHVRLALVAGLVAVLVMVGVTCWLGFGALASQRADEQRAEFLRVGRQGAVDLTTIDYTRVDENNYNDPGGFFSADKKANQWTLSYVRRF